MANGNTTRSSNLNRFSAKVAGAVMAGLALVGCATYAHASDDGAKAAPVPAQTDKSVEPNGPATQPTTKETDKSGNPCVGPTFAKLFDATACLRDSAGYEKAWPTTKIAADGDGVKDDWLVRTEGGDGKDYAYHEDGTLKHWDALNKS